MDASSVPPKVDDYGMYTTEISHHNPIELKNLLSSSDSRRNSQDEDSLPNNTNLIKEIDWQGEKVKTYPHNWTINTFETSTRDI